MRICQCSCDVFSSIFFQSTLEVLLKALFRSDGMCACFPVAPAPAGGAAAAAAPAAGASAAAPAAAAKAKEPEPEEEEDMGFSLFD